MGLEHFGKSRAAPRRGPTTRPPPARPAPASPPRRRFTARSAQIKIHPSSLSAPRAINRMHADPDAIELSCDELILRQSPPLKSCLDWDSTQEHARSQQLASHRLPSRSHRYNRSTDWNRHTFSSERNVIRQRVVISQAVKSKDAKQYFEYHSGVNIWSETHAGDVWTRV